MTDRPQAPRNDGGHLFDDSEERARAFDQELAAAQEAQAAGNVAKARALLERALQHAPSDQRARNLLGLTLFKLGELENAETIYRGLIEDHPADPTLRVNLGLVFLKRGASVEAIRCFSTALDLQPDHLKAQNYLGLAYAQKGEPLLARDWFVRSGNAAMAERMTALLEAAPAEPAPHVSTPPPSVPPPASAPARTGPIVTPSTPIARIEPTTTHVVVMREAAPSAVQPRRTVDEVGTTSEFAAPGMRSDTGEFARLPPLGTESVPPLPAWPPQPSGSSIEGATEAMQRAYEAPVVTTQPPPEDPADTDPSMPPTSMAMAAAPDEAPPELASAPAPSPTPVPVSTPVLDVAPAPPSAPVSSPPAGSSAGAPRPVEPAQLSSYTSQRRLEVPASESSFAIGSSEVVIQVRGEMLTRLDGLVASWGTATVRTELKRFRGKATDKPFGEGPRRMLRVTGEGRYVIARDGRSFTPLELGDEPAYFREEVLFAFEESLLFENGRVPSKLGGDLHLVHLRGRGRLLLVSGGEPRSVEVRKGEPLRIPMEQLVGWHGPLIQPRVVPIVEETPELGIALELSGEGSALVDAPDGD